MEGLRGAGTRSSLLDRLFGIDLRALASFRICVGLILLVDLLDRASDLELHYGDAGVLPRADHARLFELSPWHRSVHSLTGSAAGQAAVGLGRFRPRSPGHFVLTNGFFVDYLFVCG